MIMARGKRRKVCVAGILFPPYLRRMLRKDVGVESPHIFGRAGLPSNYFLLLSVQAPFERVWEFG